MAKKPVTLRCYRAVFTGDEQGTLQELLAQAHAVADDVESRLFPRTTGEQLRGALVEEVDVGTFMRVSTSLPGGNASIISNDFDQQSSTVQQQPPPEASDYLDGDAFALVAGNNVLTCAGMSRDSSIKEYFVKLLTRHGDPAVAATILLSPVANVNIARQIDEEGVKRVKLNASAYRASLLRNAEQVAPRQQLLGGLARLLQPLFARDVSDAELAQEENLLINLEVRVDGDSEYRHRSLDSYGETGRKHLSNFAQLMLDGEFAEDDNFIIETRVGSEIFGHQVKIRKQMRLPRNGQTVFDSDVKRELKQYLAELRRNGLLEQ